LIEINKSLEKWIAALEEKRLKISKSKTKTILYDFEGSNQGIDSTGYVMEMSDNIVNEVNRFNC